MKREQTVYVIDYLENKVRTKADIRKQFIKCPEELRWDFCNSADEYIYRMQEQGKMLVVSPNGYIVSNKIISPKQYGTLLKINIPSSVDIATFDKIVADKYNLWNYTLNEYKHIVENKLKVVVVKFHNGEYRFVEVR